MYDITSPATFTDISRWIGAVQEVSASVCGVCNGYLV